MTAAPTKNPTKACIIWSLKFLLLLNNILKEREGDYVLLFLLFRVMKETKTLFPSNASESLEPLSLSLS